MTCLPALLGAHHRYGNATGPEWLANATSLDLAGHALQGLMADLDSLFSLQYGLLPYLLGIHPDDTYYGYDTDAHSNGTAPTPIWFGAANFNGSLADVVEQILVVIVEPFISLVAQPHDSLTSMVAVLDRTLAGPLHDIAQSRELWPGEVARFAEDGRGPSFYHGDVAVSALYELAAFIDSSTPLVNNFEAFLYAAVTGAAGDQIVAILEELGVLEVLINHPAGIEAAINVIEVATLSLAIMMSDWGRGGGSGMQMLLKDVGAIINANYYGMLKAHDALNDTAWDAYYAHVAQLQALATQVYDLEGGGGLRRQLMQAHEAPRQQAPLRRLLRYLDPSTAVGPLRQLLQQDFSSETIGMLITNKTTWDAVGLYLPEFPLFNPADKFEAMLMKANGTAFPILTGLEQLGPLLQTQLWQLLGMGLSAPTCAVDLAADAVALLLDVTFSVAFDSILRPMIDAVNTTAVGTLEFDIDALLSVLMESVGSVGAAIEAGNITLHDTVVALEQVRSGSGR